ncbi:hypothetical protein ACHAXR_009520 [Thalassiosira sp. AJA248-18]
MFRTKINQRLSSDGERNMKHRKIFFAVVLVLVLSSFLFESDGTEQPQDLTSSLSLDENYRRSLRLAQNVDANSTIPGNKRNITIYLTGTKLADSIFKTDILPRYGSGRFDFIIEMAKCDIRSCRIDWKQQSKSFLADNQYEPCLVVGRDARNECRAHNLKCNYPQCKTMVTNDEKCRSRGYDVREYYSATISSTRNMGYLPLGPRFHAWKSFQKIRSSPGFFVKQVSERKHAFNAIFSQSTNEGRYKLAKIIEDQRDKSTLPIFTTMAKKWTSKVNNPRTEQLDTDHYMEAVLDSVFTLSPAGHNPECYRLFEAVEAGSIPILVKKDMYVRKNQCRDALHHWYDAPIVVLESWDDLFPTVEKLMGDLKALDEMQAKLRTWYDEYMRKVIGEFEDYMIDSYRLPASVEESKLTESVTAELVTSEEIKEIVEKRNNMVSK